MRKYSTLTATGTRNYNGAVPTTLQRSIAVKHSRPGLLEKTAGVLVGIAFLTLSGTSLATEQSQDRQQGRQVNQQAKQEARKEKIDCRAENNKSNAECRQDKRDTKQEGRQTKRDVKRQ
jgi:membrane protease subunit (stomatin/prohibitin family)